MPIVKAGPGVRMPRGTLLLAILVAVSGWLLIGPVTNSYAGGENFCSEVWLQPYGQAGDRCTAPNGGYIWGVTLLTRERAGCEDIENNGVLLASWTCIGAANQILVYYSGNQWAHGIIRNNNLSYAGRFTASQNYF